jgi:hypothetical protein
MIDNPAHASAVTVSRTIQRLCSIHEILSSMIDLAKELDNAPLGPVFGLIVVPGASVR